jgi:hypothetical protein
MSCSAYPILSALFCLSWSALPVPFFMSRFACPAFCPVLPVLMSSLSWLSFPGSPFSAFLYWLACSSSLVLQYMSSSTCPALPACSARPVLPVQICLSRSVTVPSCLSRSTNVPMAVCLFLCNENSVTWYVGWALVSGKSWQYSIHNFSNCALILYWIEKFLVV